MEDIEHILTCSVCMELFKHPRMIPCQHNFCEKCLADFITSSLKKKHKTNPGFACPLCRANILLKKQPFDGSEFPVNLTLQSLLDSKELIHALESNKPILHREIEKSTSFGVMSKLKKKILTRTKSSQTELKYEDTIHNTKPNKTVDRSRRLNSSGNKADVMDKDFLTQYFTFQNVPNLFEIVLQKLMESVISLERNRKTKKQVLLFVLCIISVLLYLHLALFSFAFEWESLFLNISIMSAMIQLCFVRLKIDITMYRNRLFALSGYFVTYVTTFYMIGFLYRCLAIQSRDFVLYQKYGFTIEEQPIFTPGGLKFIQVKTFNASIDVMGENFELERKAIFSDFVSITNAFCSKFWTDMYLAIQEIWHIILCLFIVVDIVMLCVSGVKNNVVNVRYIGPNWIHRRLRR